MAEQNPPAAESEPEEKPVVKEPPQSRCERIIRELYGYGIPKSKAVAEKLGQKNIGDIVSLDERNQRHRIRRLIDQALSPKPQSNPNPKPNDK